MTSVPYMIGILARVYCRNIAVSTFSRLKSSTVRIVAFKCCCLISLLGFLVPFEAAMAGEYCCTRNNDLDIDVAATDAVSATAKCFWRSGWTGFSLRYSKCDAPNQPAPPVNCGTTSIYYQAYAHNAGWLPRTCQGSTAGTTGQHRRLESIKIWTDGLPPSCKLKYRLHVAEKGWSPWAASGDAAGITDESHRAEALEIRLEDCPGWIVTNRAHVENRGWSDWASGIAGTTGQALQLQAVQIRLAKQ